MLYVLKWVLFASRFSFWPYEVQPSKWISISYASEIFWGIVWWFLPIAAPPPTTNLLFRYNNDHRQLLLLSQGIPASQTGPFIFSSTSSPTPLADVPALHAAHALSLLLAKSPTHGSSHCWKSLEFWQSRNHAQIFNSSKPVVYVRPPTLSP